MSSRLTRRDFLKLTSALALTPLAQSLPIAAAGGAAQGVRPNILVILFDALSAHHLSLYGYPRRTSPNLERFAAQANVYHNHHTAGNYTTPSTASLFTSTYPWTHRALNLSSLISPQVQPYNLFRLMEGFYTQAAFAQNTFADMLLYQFQEYLGRHEPVDSFSLAGHTFYDKLLKRDAIYGMKSLDQFLFKREEAHGSLFLSLLNDWTSQLGYQLQSARLKGSYPSGPPRLANTDVYFDLGQTMDGVMEWLDKLPAPSLAYLHFMPPHAPYVPTRQYAGAFADGWAPETKKKHRLAAGVLQERLNSLRQTYDEFIANLDAEFGRLLDRLEQRGWLENSYVIFTSDHGELFERGASGHSTPLVFEPGIRVPLIISTPGQSARREFTSLTSNVDLLPSLLWIAGQPIPDWCEGQALPGLGGEETKGRTIYVVEAKANPAFTPLRKATLALLRWPYKLVHYLGYRYYPDNYELYDLENDPEERRNLYPEHPAARTLQAELDEKLRQVNEPYQRKG